MATDRELGDGARTPGPDEYRCLVQGVAVAGPVLLAFSLLDDGDGPQRRRPWRWCGAPRTGRSRRHQGPWERRPAGRRTARRRPLDVGRAGHGAARAGAARPGLVAAARAPGLEGVGAGPPRRRPRGVGDRAASVRRPDPLGLAGRGAGAARRRGLPRSGLVPDREARPAWTGSRLDAGGGEARAWYTVSDEGPATRHLSAWRYRDGACLHLHLSLPGDVPDVDSRLEQGLRAARYGEAL